MRTNVLYRSLEYATLLNDTPKHFRGRLYNLVMYVGRCAKKKKRKITTQQKKLTKFIPYIVGVI